MAPTDRPVPQPVVTMIDPNDADDIREEVTEATRQVDEAMKKCNEADRRILSICDTMRRRASTPTVPANVR